MLGPRKRRRSSLRQLKRRKRKKIQIVKSTVCYLGDNFEFYKYNKVLTGSEELLDWDLEEVKESSTTSLAKFAEPPKLRVSKIFLNEVKQVFELFDKTGLGRLDVNHLKVILRALGFQPTADDINRLLTNIDKRNARFLSECEFREIMAAKLNDKNTKSEISRAFKLFDDDNTGKISFENIKRVSQELGENLEDEELKEMIEEADFDGDGEISEQEFARIMKKANLI